LIWELLLVVVAYLLGSVPSALFVVWMMTGRDVRDLGSGNIGATNATRAGGIRAGLVVTFLDVAKGALPVWAMSVFHPAGAWLAATMLAAVIGHCYPIWLKFRGGKGVATGFGAFVLSPWTALAALVLWLIVLVIWRRVSLASMVASAAFPLLLVMIDRPNAVILGAVSLASVLIVLRHHDNIRHLLAGDEPKIGSSRGGDR
jgi:glycerol-3-phosphate acyltransferase PlsY